jgi:hypothetical protein
MKLKKLRSRRRRTRRLKRKKRILKPMEKNYPKPRRNVTRKRTKTKAQKKLLKVSNES